MSDESGPVEVESFGDGIRVGTKVKRLAESKVDGEASSASPNNGCFGVVKSIREEVVKGADSHKQNSFLVSILWDNGTLSYLTPSKIVKA